MCLIILTEENDYSTTMVLDWVIYYKVEYILINEKTELSIEQVALSNKQTSFKLIANNNSIDSINITAFWYRRYFFAIKENIFNNNTEKSVEDYIHLEQNSIVNLLYTILIKNFKSIGNPYHRHVDKIIQLFYAKKNGFLIPNSIITDNIMDVKPLGKDIIIKPIKNTYRKKVKGYQYNMYTEKISADYYKIQSTRFSLTLFQSLVKKKYELRIFFFKDLFFASAIFSQNDQTTCVDFRKYNFNKPNRVVPYNINYTLKLKLSGLVNSLSLDTGSIDLIVDINDNIYFLEVNPVGQFGMVTIPCNYNSDKKIIEYLRS